MHTKTIVLPKSTIARVNKMLNAGAEIEDAGQDDVLETFTAKFDHDGHEADIKVVNSDGGPYIDAVLFQNGNEVDLLEPSYRLDGEYAFDEFKVIIKAGK